ncbi:hypothetical protein [Streptomyces flavovirens]
MKRSMRWLGRAGVVSAGLALAAGSAAVPTPAAPSARSAPPAAARATAEPAPAPTGLSHTYDADTQTVTVTWDPKSPTDTATQYYAIAMCNGGELCFVLAGVAIHGTSYQYRQAPGRTNVMRVYAVNSAFQRTGSAFLTVTT